MSDPIPMPAVVEMAGPEGLVVVRVTDRATYEAKGYVEAASLKAKVTTKPASIKLTEEKAS